MATLTEVAYYARKSVVYGGLGLVSLIVFRVVWGIFSSWWIAEHPPPPPPPTVAFGVLPSPVFPGGKMRRNLSLRLETISGTLPELETQQKVFFMPAFRANVFGLELATEMATKLGFLFTPTRIDEQVYEWTRERDLPGKLSVNLITGHFTLTTLWYKDAAVTSAEAPSGAQAERTAKDYLRSAKLLPDDLAAGRTRVEYLRAGAGVLVPAVSQSEANFVRVHLFRSNVEEIPVMTSGLDQALVQVVVSGGQKNKQIIDVRYRYSPVELDRAATYPLRSTQEAWKLMQAGQGYVAKIVEGASGTVVRNVKLGYYDSETPQEFLQPIFVFEGDNGFLGYVPAVSPKWLVSEVSPTDEQQKPNQ